MLRDVLCAAEFLSFILTRLCQDHRYPLETSAEVQSAEIDFPQSDLPFFDSLRTQTFPLHCHITMGQNFSDLARCILHVLGIKLILRKLSGG